MSDGKPSRIGSMWQQWNELSYLSPFERVLNRSLWGLFWIAMGFSVLQHLVLSNIPEAFRGGARLGDLVYDLAIAYVGAFAFYLLVVRLPLRRDRRNIYRHLAPLIGRVVGEAQNLIGTLNEAAGFDSRRASTLTNVEEVCSKIGPHTEAKLLVPAATGQGFQNGTILDAIDFHLERARKVNREILDLSTFVPSEVISLITSIENHGYFRIHEMMGPMWRRGMLKSADMSGFGRHVFDYLQIVDHLDQYQQEFLPDPSERLDYLVAGSERSSRTVPLRRFTADATPGASAALTRTPRERSADERS